MKTKICITGATGFIGKNLLNSLSKKENLEIIALSRKISPQMDNSKKGNITWRRCNGFSLLDAEKATEGADVLIYLIHSMLPATALSQGSFSDFDLYLADNFARAARKNGIKKIIYLSGLIPDCPSLSPHLQSRLEVEKILSQYNNNLTVLRAGLIVGRNGSSFKILERLIKRLPLLVCPAWTLSRSQTIDIKDVLVSLQYSIDNYNDLNPVYDIGGPDIITYRKMLETTAKILKLKRIILNVPFFSLGLSKLWVSKVSSASHHLVYPLIESLKHEMIADEKKLLKIPNHNYITFENSLRAGISPNPDGLVRTLINYNASINFRWLENVTSIQRVKNTSNLNVETVATKYFSWLPRFFPAAIQVKTEEDIVIFKFMHRFQLLKLEKCIDRSDFNRIFYYIRGGLLARETALNGRLEFRTIPQLNCVLIALLDYRPSLPWFIYKYTQALLHLFVMKRFSKHLEKHSK